MSEKKRCQGCVYESDKGKKKLYSELSRDDLVVLIFARKLKCFVLLMSLLSENFILK